MSTWFGGERNLPEIPHRTQKFLFHPGHSARNDAHAAIEGGSGMRSPGKHGHRAAPDAPGE